MRPDFLPLSRRAFCGTGLATLAPVSAAAMTAATPGLTRIAVVEPGSRAARQLSASARAAGLPVHPLESDASIVWDRHLRRFWQQQGAATETVGITSLGALFCLDLLARDAGQRLVLAERIDPDAPADLPALLRRAPLRAVRTELDSLPHTDTATALYAWVLRDRKTMMGYRT